ncbi:reverse transcriptase domain-containing protein [Tanacetum coccineum]
MFEHCFENLPENVRAGLRETRTDLVGFAGEVAKPLGKIDLEVRFGNEGLSRRTSMKFIIIRAPSPYNVILGRPGLKILHAIPLTIHSMIKFPTPKGIATLIARTITIAECRLREEKQMIREETPQEEEGVDVTEQIIVNPSFPDQWSPLRRLSQDCKEQLKTLLKGNMEVFAWEPADMTGVPRKVIEHALNVNPSLDPVCQKRRTFSPEKSGAVTKEVTEWIKAGIVVDCKVEGVMGFKYKCFLDAYKGYHQIQMAKEDKEKTAFYTEQGTLTPPFPEETLYAYLAVSREAVSAVLLTDRNGRQCPVQYVSRTLNEAERNYSPLEKLALSLINMTRRLRRYFEAHPVKVITDQPIKNILSRTEASGKLAKYAVEIGTYKISFIPRNAVKGQVLADFLSDAPDGEREDEYFQSPEVSPGIDDTEAWTLYTDGAASSKGSGAGLILTGPSGVEYAYALRLTFASTNNEAEYEALLAGLRIARMMNVLWIEVKVDSKLVASQINGMYEASNGSMIKYLAKARKGSNQKADVLSKLATVPFHNLTKEILVEVLNERSTEAREVQTIVEEEGDNWMTPIIKYLEEGIVPSDKNKARALSAKIGQYTMESGVLFKKASSGKLCHSGNSLGILRNACRS